MKMYLLRKNNNFFYFKEMRFRKNLMKISIFYYLNSRLKIYHFYFFFIYIQN